AAVGAEERGDFRDAGVGAEFGRNRAEAGVVSIGEARDGGRAGRRTGGRAGCVGGIDGGIGSGISAATGGQRQRQRGSEQGGAGKRGGAGLHFHMFLVVGVETRGAL